MIIWRGWGILAFLFVAAAIGGGLAISSAVGLGESLLLSGILLIGAGVGTWFLGNFLNVKKADEKVEAYIQQRGAEIHTMGRAGAFTDQQGNRLPPEQAYQAAEAMIAGERQKAASAFRNRHSLFWIPMQYLGIAMAVGGVAMLISALF